MSNWIRIDTRFPSHPKVLDVGPLGEALWLRGLCYAGEHMTDGVIPSTFVKRMGDMKATAVAARLVAAGLWEETEGGYRIHDYLDWQRSRDEIADISSKRAESGRRGGKQNSSKLQANVEQTRSKTASKSEADTDTDTDTDTETEVKTPLPPQKRSGRKQQRLDLTGFAEWYERYPRKMRRVAAEAAWAKLNAEERQAAMSALIDQVHWPSMQGDEQYIPYPASWLNGHRWLDERPRGLSPPLPIGWTQGRMDEYVRRRRERMPIPEDAIPMVDAYIAALEGRQAA